MGYRSDIGLCISSDALLKFNRKMTEITSDSLMNDLQCLLSCRVKIIKGDKAELWFWESVKWYLNYPEISFIEDFLIELDEEEYLFIRIGESDDDAEIKGCYYDNPFGMYLTRSITFDNLRECA